MVYQIEKDGKPVEIDASNLMTEDDRKLWLSSKRTSLEQSCLIIDLTAAKFGQKLYFKSIGFRCWHAYSTNPKMIRISFSSTDKKKTSFIPWQTATLELHAGTQVFDLKERVKAS